MAQTVGVRSVFVGSEPKIQGIINPQLSDCTLQEPAELLYLKISTLNTEHPVASNHFGYKRSRCSQLHHASSLGHILVFCGELQYKNLYAIMLSQIALLFRP